MCCCEPIYANKPKIYTQKATLFSMPFSPPESVPDRDRSDFFPQIATNIHTDWHLHKYFTGPVTHTFSLGYQE